MEIASAAIQPAGSHILTRHHQDVLLLVGSLQGKAMRESRCQRRGKAFDLDNVPLDFFALSANANNCGVYFGSTCTEPFPN
jgi:hypothetical protein